MPRQVRCLAKCWHGAAHKSCTACLCPARHARAPRDSAASGQHAYRGPCTCSGRRTGLRLGWQLTCSAAVQCGASTVAPQLVKPANQACGVPDHRCHMQGQRYNALCMPGAHEGDGVRLPCWELDCTPVPRAPTARKAWSCVPAVRARGMAGAAPACPPLRAPQNCNMLMYCSAGHGCAPAPVPRMEPRARARCRAQ